jgi:hypothetical protein
MYLIEICFLLLLLFIATTTLYRTYTSIQALRWQQFMLQEINYCCEGMGFIGCSILHLGVKNIDEIERLLSCEYNRYEVIIIINHALQPELFASIIKHYRMARVNLPQHTTHSLSETNLYRSTARNFRRLSILDCPTEDKYQAFNDAISITSYDYIIPLCSPFTLLPYAIESIVITLSDTSAQHIELLYNNTLSPCCVFKRDSLIMRGGLSHDIVRLIPHNLILKSNTAFTYKPFTHKSHFTMWLTTLFIVFICVATAFAISLQAALACGVTFALIACLARLILRLWTEENCSARAIFYHIGKLPLLFRSIKFNIS